MNEKEIKKKKNDFLKSVMGNKKLAKTFGDAMSSPIGSTKRDQAKSVLSIMKKLSGAQRDGMGGPYSFMVNEPVGASQTSQPNDNSNLMIFSVAPKLKTKTSQEQTSPPTPSKNIIPYNNAAFSSDLYGRTYVPPTSQEGPLYKLGQGVLKGMGNFGEETIKGGKAVSSDIYTSINPWSSLAEPLPFGPDNPPYGAYPQSTPMFKGKYVEPDPLPFVSKTISGLPSYPGQTKGDISTDTDTSTQLDGTTGGGTTGGGTTEQYDSFSDLFKSNLRTGQDYVDRHTGPATFALDMTNKQMGGSIEDLVADIDKEILEKYNLEPDERILSELKARKDNLLPSMQEYIRKRDKYIKFVDKAIDETEANLLKTDMSDPVAAASYNNYLNYLYTLKSRQSQRYGTFINSAISEYNSELTRRQSNYDNKYKRMTDELDRTTTIQTGAYEMYHKTFADMYTALANAPMQAENLTTIRLQNLINSQKVIAEGLKQASHSDPDFFKNVGIFSKHISDDEKSGINLDTIPPGGLITLYQQAENLGEGENIQGATTESIRREMQKALKTPSTDSMIKKALSYANLINEMGESSYPNSAVFSGGLSSAMRPQVNELLSDYVLENFDKVIEAAEDLVSEHGGFLGGWKKGPGVGDIEQWKEDNDELDSTFLNSLANTVQKNIQPGTSFENDPSLYIDRIFQGRTNKEKSESLSKEIGLNF